MSRVQKWPLFVLMLSAGPFAAWAAEDDCALAARYHQLATTAKAEFRQQDAYDFLSRAAAACRTYQYVQERAELATEFGDPQFDRVAADGFGEALDLADSDAQRARSIARYAQVLFHADDPQNAMTYIVAARNLDPNNTWIAELSEEITARASNVTPEDIKRGLGDMAFKPLRLQRTLTPGTGTGGGSGMPTAAPQEKAAGRSINIPLNFVVNSTALDSTTQANLKVLADTLVGDEFADERFLFVGHADARGDASTNMLLSVQRANAVFEAIKRLQPTLSPRIDTAGRGEEVLLSTGQSEADHRINRRLEVRLIERGSAGQ